MSELCFSVIISIFCPNFTDANEKIFTPIKKEPVIVTLSGDEHIKCEKIELLDHCETKLYPKKRDSSSQHHNKVKRERSSDCEHHSDHKKRRSSKRDRSRERERSDRKHHKHRSSRRDRSQERDEKVHKSKKRHTRSKSRSRS